MKIILIIITILTMFSLTACDMEYKTEQCKVMKKYIDKEEYGTFTKKERVNGYYIILQDGSRHMVLREDYEVVDENKEYNMRFRRISEDYTWSFSKIIFEEE